MGLHDQLRTLRKQRGLTAEQLAVAAGISVSTVHRIEAGRRSPSLPTLGAIAAALSTTAAEILAGVETPQT